MTGFLARAAKEAAIVVLPQPPFPLMMPYEKHRDKRGNEYYLLTGELQEKNVIDIEVEE